MPKFSHDPPLPAVAAALPAAFRQEVTLVEARRPIARATWAALPRQPGAAVLLDAEVDAARRRTGRGSAILKEVVGQFLAHCRLIETPPRRLVALVNQPDVIARAWLGRNGFVHVHTLGDLHAEAEVMVMSRTFD